MGLLSSYVRSSIRLLPIHSVVLDELRKGEANLGKLKDALVAARSDKKKLKKLIKDSGFKDDECRFVLGNIRSDIRKAESLCGKFPEKVACYGDAVLKAAYKHKDEKKVVDVLALSCPSRCKSWGWFLAECKFEVKTQVGGPFSAEDNFEETVDRKFVQVQKKMSGDKEPYARERLVMVVSHELQKCIRHLASMRRGTIGKKIDWTKYRLCTVDDVCKLYKQTAKRFSKVKDEVCF